MGLARHNIGTKPFVERERDVDNVTWYAQVKKQVMYIWKEINEEIFKIRTLLCCFNSRKRLGPNVSVWFDETLCRLKSITEYLRSI